MAANPPELQPSGKDYQSQQGDHGVGCVPVTRQQTTPCLLLKLFGQMNNLLARPRGSLQSIHHWSVSLLSSLSMCFGKARPPHLFRSDPNYFSGTPWLSYLPCSCAEFHTVSRLRKASRSVYGQAWCRLDVPPCTISSEFMRQGLSKKNRARDPWWLCCGMLLWHHGGGWWQSLVQCAFAVSKYVEAKFLFLSSPKCEKNKFGICEKLNK